MEGQVTEGLLMDATPIPDGPLKGLPAWIKDIRSIFLSYGQQLSELTAYKSEMDYAVATVGHTIILRLPEEVGKGGPDGNETVTECACRLIREYADMKMQFEPVMARLTQLETEREKYQQEKT
jgi:hypothetical protein